MPENGPIVACQGHCAVVGFAVGITEYGAGQLNEIVYATLPEVGKAYHSGDAFAELESVKAVQELVLDGEGEATCMEVCSNSLVGMQHLNDHPEEFPLVVFAGDFSPNAPMTKEEYLRYVGTL